MAIIVRFAPSPTGFLHIGSARTALFNWLFARHHGGKFLLRIEDTDRFRSTPEAVSAIFDSLSWLGLESDEKPVFQFERSSRHAQIARDLVAEGKAYFCYCTPEELNTMRTEAKDKGLSPRYNGYWRDRDPSKAPKGIAPVVRLKVPQDGDIVITDRVQGDVRVANKQLDDMVLLRSDGTPTYMLSVVVDDHDMGITHVIRGDDHLTNAFRQYQLYQACGWTVPEFAHIPLIHGPDGTKLSKRHGAMGTHEYKDMGILPEAMCNALLRLGWSHGNDEIIGREDAISWFDLDAIGRSPSRFDMAKVYHLNAHYIKRTSDDVLADKIPCDDIARVRLIKGMKGLKERAKSLCELIDSASFYITAPQIFPSKEGLENLRQILQDIQSFEPFTEESLFPFFKKKASDLGLKINDFAQPLRIALTGRTVSPSLFEIMEVLGKEETLSRIERFMGPM